MTRRFLGAVLTSMLAGMIMSTTTALLELIREKKILVQQEGVLDDLEIVPAPEEHRRTYAGASLHLADEMEPADDMEAAAEMEQAAEEPAEEQPAADEQASAREELSS